MVVSERDVGYNGGCVRWSAFLEDQGGYEEEALTLMQKRGQGRYSAKALQADT